MTYPNWFIQTGASQNFASFLSKYKDVKVDFLQLGAYTGDASLWLFENVLTHPESTLTDVDTWEGSEEEAHEEFNWKSVEKTYDDKLSQWISSGNLIKKKMTTKEFFTSNDKKFEFVYVDADHHAYWALQDGLDGYSALNSGGVLAFDDYSWGPALPKMEKPQTGIDAFLVCYSNKVVVLEKNIQLWVKKVY